MTDALFPAPLYGVPPGADFPQALVEGLLARFGALPPADLARVTVYVNTRRMQRRIRALFDDGTPRLLPRLRLLSELELEGAPGLPPPVPGLRRRLELAQLVRHLIEAEPDLAPRGATFDLADSLAALMDEMQGEGVGMDRIATLDVTDLSGHWERSQKFLDLVGHFLAADPDQPLDPEARQRKVVEAILARWRHTPPPHPVIVAGSTGSRGTTALFMRAVAALPNGAVVLPGVDPDLPADVWDTLTGRIPQEDHPQYRFAALAADLDMAPQDIRPWAETPAPNPARNALLSLALRPAPVTDAWRRDGPRLGALGPAMDGVTLIEAPDQRAEASALALCLRDAVERGVTAALISPDRMLTRRVTAALGRWGIEPDDSAGAPLRQMAAGRFLRLIAGLGGKRAGGEDILTLLKHPLTARGDGRGQHMLFTHKLELRLRRHGPPFPTRTDLTGWAAETDDADIAIRAAWIADLLDRAAAIGTAPLADHTRHLIALAEALASGPARGNPGRLWTDRDGRQARGVLDDLLAEATHGGDLNPADFANLLNSLLGGEVRDPDRPHPGVMIWGTLEARVQGADLVLLAGLNDGTWPELPQPDPWLNRAMRRAAGLLSPERRVGLAAHDFQQAAGAPRIVLSRALREGEAPSVPSRWLNRLTNLMTGLPDQNGPAALTAIRDKGQVWLDMAAALDRPLAGTPPARRPSPQPPVAVRPRQLSVTAIETLIRDPYAIYARRILRLSRLDPLRRVPEPRLRGTVLHALMEGFIPTMMALPEAERAAALIRAASQVLAQHVPWPAARHLWQARIARIADRFVTEEATRQADAHPTAFEASGSLTLQSPAFTLTAKADRIDLADTGEIAIYDYKTGNPPSPQQQKTFSKQLLLTAAIAESGGFRDIPPAPVLRAVYLGLGAAMKSSAVSLTNPPIADVPTDLARLIAAWMDEDKGYTARLARQRDSFVEDFDHLSRVGEWDLSDEPSPERVGS
ncbi:MAG: double-strand break repair protein AddB [Qingshengfaniella sp.]